ncbi:hypothetical protein F4859DRAFT_49976 [Xylaria cf. heliscus]|nr:hypothetical protein F4859DRAFT_49976 [Xylaria cf. heliscus]
MNKAHIWAHELMHVDWAVNALSYGPNKHIGDLQLILKANDKSITVAAYGPQVVKALARYAQDTGEWVIRNADSLSLYATVRYIQSKLHNVYPHLPLAPAAPSDVRDPDSCESNLVSMLSSDKATQSITSIPKYN